ncbi:MAG: hypothetical protein H3Z50_08125 [archaeon]|nr:hypothetical protein [archaeon]MCP8305488.1 hypothetical protein [archaeon]
MSSEIKVFLKILLHITLSFKLSFKRFEAMYDDELEWAPKDLAHKLRCGGEYIVGSSVTSYKRLEEFLNRQDHWKLRKAI